MKLKKFLTIAGLVGLAAIGAYALTLQEAGIENPEGKSVMLKDVPPEPRLYAIPPECNLKDKESFKKLAEKGKEVFNTVAKGNCVACHCAQDAKGCGNIGPDLTGYKNGLFKAQGYRGEEKTIDWLYQKIADGRVLIPKDLENVPYYHIMTVQLTTGQLTYEEVCQLTAYVLSQE
jgi:sulfur-oxidizing protein SoxX